MGWCDMGLIDIAKMELMAAGFTGDDIVIDGPKKWLYYNILELIEVFAKQGHSKTSAEECAKMFYNLVNYDLLSPLTGEDWEWDDMSLETGFAFYQNKRCDHVFKINGHAFDASSKVFWRFEDDENGNPIKSYFCHNVYSLGVVKFPYTPKSELFFYAGICPKCNSILTKEKGASNIKCITCNYSR